MRSVVFWGAGFTGLGLSEMEFGGVRLMGLAYRVLGV